LKIGSPEELTILDPCMGSGHILTYAFDLLTKIYEEEGYNKSDIPSLILQNNIYGCDIDKRAATLAQFALMMKARMYYRRFFKKGVNPKVLELHTESLNEEQVAEYLSSIGTDLLTVDISTLVESFKDVKNIGSLVDPTGVDIDAVEARFNTLKPEQNLFYNDIYQTIKALMPQAKMLSSTYACVVTNPPYMGSKGMNKALSDFVKKKYPDSKSDLFAVFMERTLELTEDHGFMAMINQHSWMFLSSYEKLRKKIIENHKIDTLVHLGPRAFEEIGGEVVQSVAFVLQRAGLSAKASDVLEKGK
jgi:type II restriction/modification system DNA methylase subunit YeeA